MKVVEMQINPSFPKFNCGQFVKYIDRNNRSQTGVVLAIVAKWGGSLDKVNSYITYTISHPTYVNKRTYVGEDDLWKDE